MLYSGDEEYGDDVTSPVDDLDGFDEDSGADDADDFGFCDTPGCLMPGEHFYPSECETIEDRIAWEAAQRQEERRRRWPRLYAVLDWFRSLPSRARQWVRLPSRFSDGEIPF